MINPGYNISIDETMKLKEFRNSEAYSTYLKSIAASPAFTAIMQEHISNIDITDEVKRLKEEGRIPEGASARDLSTLFKQTLNRMAMGICADSIILRELEEIRVEKIVKELQEDSDTIYLLGKADEKYYKQAKQRAEENELEKDSIAFRGLMQWMKNNDETLKKATRRKSLTPADRLLDDDDEGRASVRKRKADIDSNAIKL